MGKEQFSIQAIGEIKRDKEVRIIIKDDFKEALKKVEEFSHVLVLWWANKHDKESSRSICVTELPYAENTKAGVFACRSEYRPNPIAVTICPVVRIDHDAGIIEIIDIDAYDETPVLDIKPYIPVCDRVEEFRIPDWFTGWPVWLPEKGLGLEYD